MRAALFASMVALASVVAARAHAQGHPIGAAGDVISIPAGFFGGGFAPTPTAAQLDSDEWIPYGIDGVAPSFGSTCTAGACARGRFGGILSGTLPGVYAVDPIPGFLPSPGVGMQSGIPGGTLRPGGLRFRFHNIEAVPLRAAVIRIRWASNAGMLVRNDLRARFLPSCDPARGVPLAIGATATATFGPWQTLTETSATLDLNVPSGSDACVEIGVGASTTSLALGMTALLELSIQFPDAVCGDRIVQTGEECEPSAGVAVECGCTEACLFPRGAPCDAGLGPCAGACADGHCVETRRTDTLPVAGCDDGLFCNGLELCTDGACETVPETLCADDPCAACDEDGDTCGERTPGCCASDFECVGACEVGVCLANVCVLDGTCADAGSLDDAGQALDAATLTDGSSGQDGGEVGSDSGGPAFDAGARIANGFGGGGGCRCAITGRGPSGTSAIGLGLLLALVLQRRLRRTRETPHASA